MLKRSSSAPSDEVKQDTLNEIAGKFVDAGVTERHVERERSLYTDVYGIDPDNPEDDIQTLFDISIQNRAWSLSPSEYHALSDDFDPGKFLNYNSRTEVFNNIRAIDDLGPKVANELLRKAVHVLRINENWENDLHVPLDTHVVKALVKTEAIDLGGEDWEEDCNKNPQRVVNMDPDADPSKRVGYTELQDGFDKAASQLDLPRITFDELWVEHSRFIANPLLQSESTLWELVAQEFRY